MEQFKARNLSMLMDLYSMTMSNGYYLENTADNLVAFDVFYRRNPDGGGFAIFAGLEQVLDFLEDFHIISPYILSPPAPIPSTIYFCANTYIRKIGTLVITKDAITSPVVTFSML